MSPARSFKLKKIKFKNWLLPIVTSVLFVGIVTVSWFTKADPAPISSLQSPADSPVLESTNIPLPTPAYRSSTSIEASLKARRTRRAFENTSVSLQQASQLLWSAQGVTAEWGGRTTPSAKSTYPLNVYLISHNIEGLKPGQYLYIPGEREMVHALKPIKEVETKEAFFVSLNQNSFKDPSGILVITGNMGKMAQSYGGISHDKDVYIEAGHAAQNVYLQAESLKLGVVANTSFDTSIISNIITIPEDETLIYLIPFGKPID